MDKYRVPNAFLTDADITTLLDMLHALYVVEYVNVNEHIRGVPMVRAEKLAMRSDDLPLIDETVCARVQGIILRLSEALEHKETIFE